MQTLLRCESICLRAPLQMLLRTTAITSVTSTVRHLYYKPIETTHKITVGHKMTCLVEENRARKQHNDQANAASRAKRSKQVPIISCPTHKKFNHYMGQRYGRSGGPPNERDLASYGWRGRNSALTGFTINAVGSHPSVIDQYVVADQHGNMPTFADLGLHRTLARVVHARLGLRKPTHVQLLALNELHNQNQHALVVAETGGGKTLAYVLPLLDACVRVVRELRVRRVTRSTNQPLCLILVPTRELVFQVHAVVQQLLDASADESKELSSNDNDNKKEEDETDYAACLRSLSLAVDMSPDFVKMKNRTVMSNNRKSKSNTVGAKSGNTDSNENEKSVNNDNNTIQCLKKPISVDILISTPTYLLSRLTDSPKHLDTLYLKKVVVDEADTLLDDSNSEDTLNCLSSLLLNFALPRPLESDTSIVVNAADTDTDTDSTTIDESAEAFDTNAAEQSNAVRLANTSAQLIEPSTQLVFVSATTPRDLQHTLANTIGISDKKLRLIETGRANRLPLHVPQRFVRCTADARSDHLLALVRTEVGRGRICMIFSHHTATAVFVSKYLRENGVECELLCKKVALLKRERLVRHFFEGRVPVLSCTDIASRGWNTLNVHHVINFEMPPFVADYLHRIGRVGRMGSHGPGMVTSFVTKGHEAQLVLNIERSVRTNSAERLDNVDGNIKRLYKQLHSTGNVI